MFQLNNEEFENLRSQFVTSPKGGGRQYFPYAFTEQGVAMLSGILKSQRAIDVNIQIMRTFAALRQWAIENKELAQRLTELEHYFMQHCRDNQADMQKIYDALGLLMDRTKPAKIGFLSKAARLVQDVWKSHGCLM